MSYEKEMIKWKPVSLEPEALKLERDIQQMRNALVQIREQAATKENGGAWAAGIANLCLATLRS